ncbi:NAD(P)-binding protein [Dendrothele bispora CBS 962.96]|uniref:NAD(P)-binding protein n=1 Tax=Dendrothele bispora (strain CBS 962.96) TaxID=1314807 RepID=A0A4S8KXM2_DENBC|nr:NAD(P)-binding protein [Dendrothele bispora CBS 962.96]THV07446.1 NAD(P)-binding protein [Dendrothele bispora CBS 962.96]
MSPTKVLFFGATGYVGGCALTKIFLDRKGDEEVTVLARNPQKAEKLEKYGVKTVIGDLRNAELVEKLVSESDIVINIADSWDTGIAKSILNGLKKRFEATGTRPVYFYETGIGALIDDARGNVLSDVIWDDTNVEQMASIEPDAIHRAADLAVINADEEGYCRAYLIMPSAIWGKPQTKLVEDGIQNPHSVPVPTHANIMFDIGHAGVAGKGISQWCHIEVNDLASLWVTVYDAVRADPDGTRVGHGADGYYIAENGQFTWMQFGEACGKALHAVDPSKSETVSSYTPEEEAKHPMVRIWGSNARAVSNHARNLGWKPLKTVDDFLGSVLSEMERWMKDGMPLESQLAQMSSR